MRFQAMDSVHGLKSKPQTQVKNHFLIESFGFQGNTHSVIIRVHNSWVLKLLGRFLLLALVILSLPCFNALFHASKANPAGTSADQINVELLPLLFRDLANDGLLKLGDRALFLGNGEFNEAVYNSPIINEHNMDLISYSDSSQRDLIPDETFDFVFVSSFSAPISEFADRVAKIGGVIVSQLSKNPMDGFQKPSNYKIVYIRKFDELFVALGKKEHAKSNSFSQRKLLEAAAVPPQEAKKAAALEKLEDVLLEPPRAASGKSRTYFKRTKYLPDLMGLSLKSYPRRVFIDVGGNGGSRDQKTSSTTTTSGTAAAATWFKKHYPTKNTDFEVYKIETVTIESSGKEVTPMIGMSEWLRKNVKEREYVVMKAEAEVVEEMLKSRAINLVDELFLECKHQGIKKGKKRSRRAYWECLALYGMLRDEGVAVHQWWG